MGNIKKIAKFLMRTFTCLFTFLYAASILILVYNPGDVKTEGWMEGNYNPLKLKDQRTDEWIDGGIF